MHKALRTLFTGLTAKIAVAIFLVLLISGAVFVFIAQKTGQEILRQEGRIKARTATNYARSVIEDAMMSNSKDGMQKAISFVLRSHDALDLAVLNGGGKVMASKDSNKLNPSIARIFQQVDKERLEDRYFSERDTTDFEWIISPLRNKPQCRRCHGSDQTVLGYVAVKVSIRHLMSMTVAHKDTNTYMMIAVFSGLGLVLFAALYVLVIRPVRNLQDQMGSIERALESIQDGEHIAFDLLPQRTSHDEISNLILAFNDMIIKLNDAHARLQDIHHSQLQEADRIATTGEMAASIAHEIRNPLASVLGALHVFHKETEDGNPRKEILHEMIVQCERMNHSLNDLLSYCRPATPVFRQVHLEGIIEKTVGMLKAQNTWNHVVLRVDADGKDAIIQGDEKQLQQVFWNLLLNALQAIHDAGTVTVSIREHQGKWYVAISDTGDGIPEDRLRSIFKPFFTTKNKGTGLGLAISRRIVEQHEGSISVESTTGVGSVFTVSFPIRRDTGERT